MLQTRIAALMRRTRLATGPHQPYGLRRRLFTSSRKPQGWIAKGPVVVIATGALTWLLISPRVQEEKSSAHSQVAQVAQESSKPEAVTQEPTQNQESALSGITGSLPDLPDLPDLPEIEWSPLAEKIVDYILPEWTKVVSGYFLKLQDDLSDKPGSLADEMWHEAQDPERNPEICYSAHVRVSNSLCEEEKNFLERRKQVVRFALAKYLGLDEKDVHPDDIPTIAVCGSGGGLRALVAGTGSLLAAEQDGLLDCVTYTAGVSGSCWLQAINFSSLGQCSIQRVLNHLKGRTGIHIAYPPSALQTLISAPTDKYLLRGLVEKLWGSSGATVGLVDIYGLLLAARLFVPVGDLEANDADLKISNQRDYVKFGQNPLPIYTAVRHEIPEAPSDSSPVAPSAPEDAKEQAKRESWFQWFEITPYEFFCEELCAGIPTWAMGRKFNNGSDVLPDNGVHQPELRMPLLMGIFGSAFCATLSHYYREVRPIMKGLAGFGAIDDLISGKSDDLSKVHPIEPASLPNFAYGMYGKLAKTTPDSLLRNQTLQLMDAGMSNNLPIYPLLRPGRDVDVIIAFDNSADIKQDNWLAVTDGYARQRGIKGWPVGVGWPKEQDSLEKTERDLDKSVAATPAEADMKLAKAQADQATSEEVGNTPHSGKQSPEAEKVEKASKDLGYCTVWVGSTQERSSSPPPPSKALDASDESWSLLSSPTAGLAVIYLPLLPNPQVPGVNPGTTEYLSTWNFIYGPEQVDAVSSLAKANYDEGKDQIRKCVRAIYERKKRERELKEAKQKDKYYQRLVRKGQAHKLGEGDLFS